MGALHTKPSALQFRYRLRWYILGKHSSDMFAENCNTKDDDEKTLVSAAEANSYSESNNGNDNLISDSVPHDIFISANNSTMADILGDCYDQEMTDLSIGELGI